MKVGEIYEYKGCEYKYLETAIFKPPMELVVVYQSLNDGELYTRPIKDFELKFKKVNNYG